MVFVNANTNYKVWAFQWKVGSTEKIIRENLGLEPEKFQSTRIRATSLLKLKSIIPQKRRLM